MEAGAADPGDLIIRAGDDADTLYLLLSGSIEVRLSNDSGRGARRLDVLIAGMSFGEMGFLDGSPRSADVVALEPVRYRVIDRALFGRLEHERPYIKIRLLEQLAKHLSAKVRRTNAEAMAFKG